MPLPAGPATKADALQLRLGILEAEVHMPRGRTGEVGDLASYPHKGEARLQRSPKAFRQGPDAQNDTVFRQGEFRHGSPFPT